MTLLEAVAITRQLPKTGAASLVIFWSALALLGIGVPTVYCARRWGRPCE